ncbi:MAG: ribonuclease P protein component [Candidatus Omnitrophica bacterium]|nr:ribonuclease P protein component [Candidatus Omnitrophota bacterium]
MAARDLYIKKTAQYKEMLQEGKKYFSPHFILYVLSKETSREYAKLGISVPKKHIKQAIKRNRIKRVLREIWRKREQKGLLDLFIIVKKDITAIKYDTISKEVNNKCDKILS